MTSGREAERERPTWGSGGGVGSSNVHRQVRDAVNRTCRVEESTGMIKERAERTINARLPASTLAVGVSGESRHEHSGK